MTKPPKVQVEIHVDVTHRNGQDFTEYPAAAELCAWKPPNYSWDAVEVDGCDLKKSLNTIEKSGWEIFQVQFQQSTNRFLIISRHPIEEDSE